MVPATEAVKRPRPTKDAKEGSWPEPPPDMRDTGGEEEEVAFTIELGLGLEVGFMYTILFSASRATEGLVRGMEARAVLTRWVGSFMKCFAKVIVSLDYTLFFHEKAFN
jgi:hypothetical protein